MSLYSEEMIDNTLINSVQVLPKKRNNINKKLDTKSKLLVIQALDSGKSKSDVARDYSVTQQTVSNIFKQKEYLLQKHALKNNLLLGTHQINIDQALLEWFLLETKCGNCISENAFRQKALAIINTVGANLFVIDEWLKEFRIKHKITEFSADIQCNMEIKNEWMKFLSDFNSSNVYFGGMFSLLHGLDTESYLNGQSSEEYVSMMFAVNSTGTDKLQLAVIGKDEFDKNVVVKSLPVKYYLCHTDTPQINYSILNDYLVNWDSNLNEAGKSILFIVNLPDNLLHKFKFENIKLLATRNLDYITHVLEKLIECFKFNYRRLQISHRIESEHCFSPQLLDYIHMFAMAWHSVPTKYIELLCTPQADRSLYFDINDENYGDHSLSHWYKIKKIPLDLDQCSDLLDKYIYCDSKHQCVNWRIEDDAPSSSSNTLNTFSDKRSESSLSLDAYQAMRRLVSYIHEQNAGPVLKQAKYLEHHTEYRALTQMHVINTNNSD